MNHFLSRGLLKMLFLFLSLDSIAQNDSILKSKHDTDQLKKDGAASAFIKIAANPQLSATGFKRSMMGKNYREEWVTPVRVPVLNLNIAYGGLVPVKMGGGKQTKSLRVENHNGKEWALRSVEKFPEKAVPPELKRTLTEKIVTDGISASYPYAALSIATFSKAAHVPFLKDSLVYIGDDPGLGEFSSKMKNTLVLMEEREPSGMENENKDNKKEKTISSQEVVYELANDNNNKIDQTAVLRARLLDNFVMDFDRHQRQWDWLGIHSGQGKIYYPIPIDRDQAFYSNSGLLSKLVSKNLLPQLQGFRAKAKDIRTFNLSEQNFDRLFLNSLSEEEWSRQIDEFLNAMTDEVIETAMHQQPAEIQKYSAEKIISTLKNKRQYFKADMMKYYRFLSETVSIVGTNDREQFTISKQADGKVSVVINKIDSAGNITGKLYERIFDPAITHELRIYGLEGDDKFLLQGRSAGITIKLVGGPGNDEFINNSDGHKVFAYDVNFEQNIFSGNQSIHKKIAGDPQNNNYTRLEYIYDKTSIGLSAEYTIGGFFIGPKLKVVKQGFRKDPYGVSHLIAVSRAVNTASYHLRYYIEFIKLFGKTDLVFHSDAWLPTSRTMFFGMGNNTVFDKTKPGAEKYYFDYYNLINISLMGRNKINSWLQFSYGPVFQYFKLSTKRNADKYIATLYPTESDFKMKHAGKAFAGGEVDLDINTKNNQVVPTRGIKLNIYGRSLAGLNKYSNPVTEGGGQLDLFTDFIAKKNVVIATSFGGNHITGKFELEQAQYLGFRQNLRGFRIDRFAGRSRAYNNSEIRLIKNDANMGLFRGSIGLFVFNDVARVWADDERSTQWHDGYGWGVFIAPLNKVVVTAMLTYSKEESNFLFINFGFQF